MKPKKITYDEYVCLENDYKAVLQENLKLEDEITRLKEQYNQDLNDKEKIQMLHDNARKLKHDMRNHLMTIAAYLNSDELNEAKHYTSKILDKLNYDYSYIESGNTLLNYIINEKLQLAKDKKIYIKAQIENLHFKHMESIDFSALLCNLLDNAIDGAYNSKEKQVIISITKRRGYDSIQIKNSTDFSVLGTNPNFITTKEDKEAHGLGITLINEIVNKYDGLIEFYEENNMFCVLVMIE